MVRSLVFAALFACAVLSVTADEDEDWDDEEGGGGAVRRRFSILRSSATLRKYGARAIGWGPETLART